MAKEESAKGHVKKTKKSTPSLVTSTGEALVGGKVIDVSTSKAGTVKALEEVKEIKQLMSPEKRTCLIPKVKLMFNNILTSAHNIHSDSILISDSKGNLSELQVVVATGPNSMVKVGDWVKVNVDMFPRETRPGKHDVGNQVLVHPPIERIGNTSYFLLTDRHIKYVIEKY